MAIQHLAPLQPTIHTDTSPTFMTWQCSECGVILGGPLAGLFPTTPEGLVALLAGEFISNGLCDRCEEQRNESYYP